MGPLSSVFMCSESEQPAAQPQSKEASSTSVFSEDEEYLQLIKEQNQNIKTFSDLLTQAQFVLQRINQKVKNEALKNREQSEDKTVETSDTDNELQLLGCSKPLSENKQVDKSLSACTSVVPKASVGVQVASQLEDNWNKPNVVIKIPLVDQPCSTSSSDVQHEELQDIIEESQHFVEPVPTFRFAAHELTPVTSVSTEISSCASENKSIVGWINKTEVAVPGSSPEVLLTKIELDTTINVKPSEINIEETSNETKVLKSMGTETLVNMTISQSIPGIDHTGEDRLNSNIEAQCRSTAPCTESCTQHKLTIQAMPSIDIRRGLVTQKIPNIIITANESIPEVEVTTKSNVVYEVIKYGCCTEKVKSLENSMQIDQGKEDFKGEARVAGFNNIQQDAEINKAKWTRSKCTRCSEQELLEHDIQIGKIKSGTSSNAKELAKTQEDVPKKVVTVAANIRSLHKYEEPELPNSVSVAVQTANEDTYSESENSSIPSFDYRCKTFLKSHSPRTSTNTTLEFPLHEAAVTTYINAAYEVDTGSEQQPHLEDATSSKLSTMEQFAQRQKDYDLRSYVKEKIANDPDAENVLKSYQLLDEALSHDPELQVDEDILSSIDVDVYKTYVNPQGLKIDGRPSTASGLGKLNCTNFSYSIASLNPYRSRIIKRLESKATNTSVWGKVNADTSPLSIKDLKPSIVKNVEDKGTNTSTTEKLNAAISLQSIKNCNPSGLKGTDQLQTEGTNTNRLEKSNATTSHHSIRKLRSEGVMGIDQLENKEANTSILEKVNNIDCDSVKSTQVEEAAQTWIESKEESVFLPENDLLNIAEEFDSFEMEELELEFPNLNELEEYSFLINPEPVNNSEPTKVIEGIQAEIHSRLNKQTVNSGNQGEDNLRGNSSEYIFQARPTIFAQQSTPNIASNFLNTNSDDSVSQGSNNTDDVIFEIQAAQLRSYSQNLILSRSNSLRPNEKRNSQPQNMPTLPTVISEDGMTGSANRADSLAESSGSLIDYIITHDVSVQTSLTNSEILLELHRFSKDSLTKGVESLKEAAQKDVLAEKATRCFQKLRWNAKKKQPETVYKKSGGIDPPKRTAVLRPSMTYSTSMNSGEMAISIESGLRKSVKIEEVPSFVYNSSVTALNNDNISSNSQIVNENVPGNNDTKNNKIDSDDQSSTKPVDDSKLDKVTIMNVNIDQPKLFAEQVTNEFMFHGNVPGGDGGDCVEHLRINSESQYKYEKTRVSPNTSKCKSSSHRQKNKFKPLKKNNDSTSSSETTSKTDSGKNEDLHSEGEIKCKCSASIGEVHMCPYMKDLKSQVQYLKRHPQDLITQEFGDPNIKIKGQTEFYSNWVAYFVSRSPSPDSDNTESLKSSTDSSGLVKK